jgi:hypothetical protein
MAGRRNFARSEISEERFQVWNRPTASAGLSKSNFVSGEGKTKPHVELFCKSSIEPQLFFSQLCQLNGITPLLAMHPHKQLPHLGGHQV